MKLSWKRNLLPSIPPAEYTWMQTETGGQNLGSQLIKVF